MRDTDRYEYVGVGAREDITSVLSGMKIYISLVYSREITPSKDTTVLGRYTDKQTERGKRKNGKSCEDNGSRRTSRKQRLFPFVGTTQLRQSQIKNN